MWAEELILRAQENRLDFKFAPNQLAENLRNVTAAFPAGVDEDCEFFRVQPERSSCGLSGFFTRP